VNKPAHTAHAVLRSTRRRVGLQSTVGLDFVVGGRGRVRLGGCPEPARAEGASTLGVDAVLGEHRRSTCGHSFQPSLAGSRRRWPLLPAKRDACREMLWASRPGQVLCGGAASACRGRALRYSSASLGVVDLSDARPTSWASSGSTTCGRTEPACSAACGRTASFTPRAPRRERPLQCCGCGAARRPRRLRPRGRRRRRPVHRRRGLVCQAPWPARPGRLDEPRAAPSGWHCAHRVPQRPGVQRRDPCGCDAGGCEFGRVARPSG
jgi:hypothetical protein